jgi:hypothetical protein
MQTVLLILCLIVTAFLIFEVVFVSWVFWKWYKYILQLKAENALITDTQASVKG